MRIEWFSEFSGFENLVVLRIFAECLLRLLRRRRYLCHRGPRLHTQERSTDLAQQTEDPLWMDLGHAVSGSQLRGSSDLPDAGPRRLSASREGRGGVHQGVVVVRHPGNELGILREVCEVRDEARVELSRFRSQAMKRRRMH